MENFYIFSLVLFGGILSSMATTTEPRNDAHSLNMTNFVRNCAIKYKVPLSPKDRQHFRGLSLEAEECLADCLLKIYIKNGIFDMSVLRTDINRDMADVKELGNMMISTYENCSKSAVKEITNTTKKPLSSEEQGRLSCPPLAGLIYKCVVNDMINNYPDDVKDTMPRNAPLKEYSAILFFI